MVATLVVLLRSGTALPMISGAIDLREAIQTLAAEVSVADNLLGAELCVHSLSTHSPSVDDAASCVPPILKCRCSATCSCRVASRRVASRRRRLWTPEDANDVMDRDDMFLNFPELVTI